MNPVYRDLVLSQSQRAVAHARSIGAVPHRGLKGQLREIVVRELLKPLLPDEYVLATGQIISAYGEVSHQVDLAACLRRLMPPILLESACGIMPLEATLFTVEIKSVLNASELQKADDAARVLAAFRYAPPVGSRHFDPEHEIEGVISYLIAFDTDLSLGGKSEIARYSELLNSQAPAIRGLCIVGRGFWFWADSRWHEWKLEEPDSELALFAAAIINTCQRVEGTRRQPDFRQYLL